MPSSSSSSSSSSAVTESRGRSDSNDTSNTKSKSGLVTQAEKYPRSSAPVSGYLKKQNSGGKWQKRWFEIVGQYFVYYKSQNSTEMLCAMDLWRASAPALQPADPNDPETGADFVITWDRFRAFRAGSKSEASKWVKCMIEVQSKRPDAATRPNVDAAVAAAVVASPSRRASRAAGGGGGGPTEATGLDSGGSISSSSNTSYGSIAKVAEWSAAEKTGGGGGGGSSSGKDKKKKGTSSKSAADTKPEKAGGCCTVM